MRDVIPFASPVFLSFSLSLPTPRPTDVYSGRWNRHSTGPPSGILEDMQVLKPNSLPAVPRLLSRIYHAVAANSEPPGLKSALFMQVVASHCQYGEAQGYWRLIASTLGQTHYSTSNTFLMFWTSRALSSPAPSRKGAAYLKIAVPVRGVYPGTRLTATKEAINKEGWVRTADSGSMDGNMVKLSQVHGDSVRSYLLAITVPDPVQLTKIASRVWKRPVSKTDLAMLGGAARDEKVAKAILDVLAKHGVRYGLKGYEFVKRIFVTNESFSVEDGCFTPTTKIRRFS
ncbi:hypothetical protein BDM02DRAFT_3129282 [Thelephora ganbajun]|uniref:Uncharacterized protein n=1 Tax=Thelephora ganbajun TaxID=370292 RepID=A0ACB6ZFH9_THEGA|nr:hypothetical protein BDM02DRAFT_3129282 [Thelephora ganbajun]